MTHISRTRLVNIATRRQQQFLPDRSSSLRAAVLLAMALPISAIAAETRSATEIEGEVARLEQQLLEQRQALDARKAQDAATASTAPSGAAKLEDSAQLGKVVVRRRSNREQLNDVPLSVSVVTGEELNRELSLDLNSITRRSASIQFNQNNTRGASLSIRGLGKRSFTETQDPSVGLVVDGVSYGLTELGNFDFYDIESVEVQRGPQGTQGGKGGSAGLVTLQTRRPSFERSADLQLTFGQRDAVLAKANLGGAIIDDLLAWRGSFIADRGRGFYASDYDPNYSFYNRNRLGGRVQFLLTPTHNLTARVSVDLEPKAPQVENGLTFRHDQPVTFADGSLTDPNGTAARARLAGFTNANGIFTDARSLFLNRSFSANGEPHANYTIGDYNAERLLQDQNQGQTVTNKGASTEINYDAGSHLITSITGWRAYSFDAHNDEGTPFDINRNGGGGVNYRQFSQEIRVSSVPGELLDYSGGAFYLGTNDTIASKTGWGSDAGAWLATNAQYNALERNAGLNRGAGTALLKDSLDDAYTYAATRVQTKSSALFGQINWHLSTALDLLTGLRVTHEDRETSDDKILSSNGVGAALNPVAVRGVSLGGFNSTTTGTVAPGLIGAGTSSNLGFLNTADPTQRVLANAVAQRYFGVSSYDALTGAQAAQVANAKAVRAAAIGALSSGVESTYKDDLLTALITPSYKINKNLTAYTSWQYGEKSGSALNVNFVAANVKPERTSAFELGLKSVLLDGQLILNGDVYHMDIRDYQTAARVVDEFTTQTNIDNGQANPIAYVTAQANVNRVTAQGVEVDSFYSGLPHTTIRLSGAYTDAKYKDFRNAAFPEELAYLSTAQNPYTDQSGLVLPGISKWTFNVGAEYRLPVWGDRELHASFNTSYNGRFNNSDLLSSYGWVSAYSRTDVAAGITTAGGIDVSLIARNVFDNRDHEAGWLSYSPYPYPRWAGVSISGKL
jgi:iron complex outermembrane receptor protein